MILNHLGPLDRRLASAGFPSLSPWWVDTVTRFYSSSARQLVLRVGRRGGKSSTLCRLAVLEALYGAHRVPPGDVGVVAIISTTRDEASQRLRTIRAILDSLHVSFRPIEHGIELADRPLAFKTFVASVAGVSGFTAICVIADEVAKWKDADTGANPATEVLASLRPTMATQPHARLFLSSSPMGMQDAHAEAFDRGDTDFQLVAHAPTWTANPTVSEERTRALEPDARVWAREYAAIPQSGSLGALDPALVDRACRIEIPDDWTRCERVMLLDPSSGKADSFTWASAGWRIGGDRRVLEIADVGGVADAVKQNATSDSLVAHVTSLAKRQGATVVHADQYEQFSLASAFSRHGLRYVVHTWSQTTKEQAVLHLRAWLRDDRIALPASHPKLKPQLLSLTETVSASGGLTFRGRGSSHDDYALLIMLAALVDIESGLPGSPSSAPLPGQGILEFYQREVAEQYYVDPAVRAAVDANGGLPRGPSALRREPHPVVLRVPDAIPDGTYQSRGGIVYQVADRNITVIDQDDLADLQTLHFKTV